ncbi:hypothetical protein AB833_28830 [Chromatiales bacterium (ex Bugula neritina AB1)]|nr:hypothetical protein AB833_28830 [Chromatiales bacterium (ex Bugula neritina AB1)]
MLKHITLASAFTLITSFSQPTLPAATDCTGLSENGPSNLIEGPAPYSFLADVMRRSSRDYWIPADDEQAQPCLVGNPGTSLENTDIIYYGFRPGIQTPLYKIKTKANPSREIVVLYSGVLDLMSGTHRAFSVTETRGDRVDIYALYHQEPATAQILTLAEDILANQKEPIVTAQWLDADNTPEVTVTGKGSGG